MPISDRACQFRTIAAVEFTALMNAGGVCSLELTDSLHQGSANTSGVTLPAV